MAGVVMTGAVRGVVGEDFLGDPSFFYLKVNDAMPCEPQKQTPPNIIMLDCGRWHMVFRRMSLIMDSTSAVHLFRQSCVSRASSVRNYIKCPTHSSIKSCSIYIAGPMEAEKTILY